MLLSFKSLFVSPVLVSGLTRTSKRLFKTSKNVLLVNSVFWLSVAICREFRIICNAARYASGSCFSDIQSCTARNTLTLFSSVFIFLPPLAGSGSESFPTLRTPFTILQKSY